MKKGPNAPPAGPSGGCGPRWAGSAAGLAPGQSVLQKRARRRRALARAGGTAKHRRPHSPNARLPPRWPSRCG
eukprot:11219611-Lingulodinium_polyedra.AAC.1